MARLAAILEWVEEMCRLRTSASAYFDSLSENVGILDGFIPIPLTPSSARTGALQTDAGRGHIAKGSYRSFAGDGGGCVEKASSDSASTDADRHTHTATAFEV